MFFLFHPHKIQTQMMGFHGWDSSHIIISFSIKKNHLAYKYGIFSTQFQEKIIYDKSKVEQASQRLDFENHL